MAQCRIAILDGIRTPFCKAGGALAENAADDLATSVVRELLARTGVAGERVDELIIGNVAQPTHAANLARVVSRKARGRGLVTAEIDLAEVERVRRGLPCLRHTRRTLI